VTRRYDAIMFDAGHTLLRVEPSVGAVYGRTAAQFGVDANSVEIDRAFRKAWNELKHGDHVAFYGATSEADERRWWRDLVVRTLALAAPGAKFAPDFDDFFDELYELFAMPEVWHVYDDVRPALESLENARVRLCVVSNWDSRLPRLLRALDLDRHFEFVLTSAEAGWRKPHRAPFDAALERLDLVAERVVHVGDSHDEDIAGARNAGIDAIMLDRERPPDYVALRVQSLHQLAELVC
jgi:putative hydrolase of the HAD superfamily